MRVMAAKSGKNLLNSYSNNGSFLHDVRVPKVTTVARARLPKTQKVAFQNEIDHLGRLNPSYSRKMITGLSQDERDALHLPNIPIRAALAWIAAVKRFLVPDTISELVWDHIISGGGSLPDLPDTKVPIISDLLRSHSLASLPDAKLRELGKKPKDVERIVPVPAFIPEECRRDFAIRLAFQLRYDKCLSDAVFDAKAADGAAIDSIMNLLSRFAEADVLALRNWQNPVPKVTLRSKRSGTAHVVVSQRAPWNHPIAESSKSKK